MITCKPVIVTLFNYTFFLYTCMQGVSKKTRPLEIKLLLEFEAILNSQEHKILTPVLNNNID